MTKRAANAKAIGRPSIYTLELAGQIFDRIAGGQGLVEICRDEAMPSRQTIYNWIRSNDEFEKLYAQACELRMEFLAEEILSIADDSTNDFTERKGVKVPDNEVVNRARLRVDSRKWLLAKLAPKKYGERTSLEHSGSVSLSELVEASMKILEKRKQPEGEGANGNEGD